MLVLYWFWFNPTNVYSIVYYFLFTHFLTQKKASETPQKYIRSWLTPNSESIQGYTSVRLRNVCCKHSLGHNNEAIDFKLVGNIASSCMQIGIENGPYRSQDAPTLLHILRTPLKSCHYSWTTLDKSTKMIICILWRMQQYLGHAYSILKCIKM